MEADTDPTVPLRGDGARADGDTEHATFGRFISLGLIGRGGMGLVLRARDPELDRDVAIKLLRPSLWGSSDPSSASRLQREARAMAKLAHPNVVAVYEMGSVGQDRFIAMELVEGTTLRRWLADRARTWREILDVFVACGRGLAAAHAAGLVHRDFKPENVLIGTDGRPRVTDFGLVVTGIAVTQAQAMPAPGESSLTVQGAVVGTPGYMAPEQWRGEEVDSRTDQFAYCVAIWEALYGQHPFADSRDADLRERVLAGQLREPARDHRADPRLLPILRRGLASDPDQRWGSMDELLAALAIPKRKAIPWLVGIGAVAVTASAALVIAQQRGHGTPDPCPDPQARLATIWDATTKAELGAAFVTANPVIADETIARVGSTLDRYAERWRGAVIAACRATKVEGTQSEELLDRRITCLDRRRSDLGALTSLLLTTDGVGVGKSVAAAGALGDLESCADPELLAASALPTDPALRRAVEKIDQDIATSFAARFAPDLAARRAQAHEALEAARALDYPPLLVRALEEAARAALTSGDSAALEPLLQELAQRASEVHDDQLAARTWLHIVVLLAQLGRAAEAETVETMARASVARAGETPELRYALTSSSGVRHAYARDADALAVLRDAVELATTDLDRAEARRVLAQATFMLEGPAAAIPLADASLAAIEQAYGPHHPLVADGLHLLAQLRTATHELDLASAAETRALEIREAALGARHRDVGMSLHTLGNIADNQGDLPAARAYFERAIEILDGDGAVNLAGLSRGMLADVVASLEGIDAARPIFVASLEQLGRTIGTEQTNYAQTEANFAFKLVPQRCDEAMPYLEHATAVLAQTSPRSVPTVLEASAQCDQAERRFDDAIAKLEHARAICAQADCGPQVPDVLTWRLGHLLVESRRDRARGRKLVEQAAADAVAHGNADVVAEIEAWRKSDD